MERTLHYAIIKAIPDPRKGERVNIGIAVFLGDRIDVRLLPSLGKLRALDPRIDVNDVYRIEEHINRLAPLGAKVELQHSMVRQLGIVEMTELAWFHASDADEYDAQVNAIMRELVEPPARKIERRPYPTRLQTAIKHALKERGLLGKSPEDVERHKVIDRYPIDRESGIYADFALRNGKWHIAETVDLRGDEKALRGPRLQQAGFKAVTLDQAVKRLRNCVPIVVYAVTEEMREAAEPHIHLVSSYAERMFNYLDPEESSAFVEYMMRASTVAAS